LKELKFIEGQIPKGFKFDFESFLFNEERHRYLQSPGEWQSFCLVQEKGKRGLASIHFHLQNRTASSPYKAPFGSVEFSTKLAPRDLYEFLKQAEKSLGVKGIRKIQIKNPPALYHPVASSVLEVLLLNIGYHILQAEIGTAIVIDDTKYDQKIEAWELRKLKQGKKAGLRFQKVPIGNMEAVYGFILACRIERQQSLSMAIAELMKIVEVYPERFILFGVYHGHELAAASISIRVSKRIVYNFYSAHPRKFDFLSPVVMLMQGMYGWSQKHHIELIDLGTSSLEGQPNFSLLDFKFRLSGNPSAKLTFEKDLS
jgi:hypothetical protein